MIVSQEAKEVLSVNGMPEEDEVVKAFEAGHAESGWNGCGITDDHYSVCFVVRVVKLLTRNQVSANDSGCEEVFYMDVSGSEGDDENSEIDDQLMEVDRETENHPADGIKQDTVGGVSHCLCLLLCFLFSSSYLNLCASLKKIQYEYSHTIYPLFSLTDHLRHRMLH